MGREQQAHPRHRHRDHAERRDPDPYSPRSTATTPCRSPTAQIDPRKVNKPATGHFEKAGVTPRRHLTEVRTADAADYTLGQELTVDGIFEAGQLVDVVGTARARASPVS